MKTTLEVRLAQLIRLTRSDREGEVMNAINAIARTLKAASADEIYTIADRLEAPNALKAEAKKVYDAGHADGYAEGVRAAEAKHHGAADFLDEDGRPTWEAVALFLQREKHRLAEKHREFVDDMAGRTAWGREPTERQHKYLHSLFFQLGGKIT